MNKPKFSKMKKFIASSALVFTLLTSSNLGLVTNTVIDTIGEAYVAYATDERETLLWPTHIRKL